MIFLMETMSRNKRLEVVKAQLGFKGLFVVDCLGHNGGLALLWREGFDVNIVGFSKNHIDTEVRLEGGVDLSRDSLDIMVILREIEERILGNSCVI